MRWVSSGKAERTGIMTAKLYLEDPYLRAFDAEVRDSKDEWCLLSTTAFYPGGRHMQRTCRTQRLELAVTRRHPTHFDARFVHGRTGFALPSYPVRELICPLERVLGVELRLGNHGERKVRVLADGRDVGRRHAPGTSHSPVKKSVGEGPVSHARLVSVDREVDRWTVVQRARTSRRIASTRMFFRARQLRERRRRGKPLGGKAEQTIGLLILHCP
jgi:hypothetical protein